MHYALDDRSNGHTMVHGNSHLARSSKFVDNRAARPLRAKLSKGIESRELCYDDDVLWSVRYSSHDSIPYCSSLLEIQDHKTTVDPVAYHTYYPPLHTEIGRS